MASEELPLWNIQVIMKGHSIFENVAKTILDQIMMRGALLGGIQTTLFGVSTQMTEVDWKMIVDSLPDGAQQNHFLWGLMFLKYYYEDAVNEAITGVSGKTFRLCAWEVIYIIATAGMVRFIRPHNVHYE